VLARWYCLKQSTRNVIDMHGWRVDRAAHNYVYFSYHGDYIKTFLRLGHGVAGLLRRLHISGFPFKMVFERYHAKVMTMEDTAKILLLNEDVLIGPDRTERIIPYRYANRIILKEPDYIAVMDCACRLTRDNPCEPVDVCMAVGRTTAQFWLEHGKKFHARRITQQEALERLREGHQRGHITTAWFKVATGGRTGVICSCCNCCCGGLEAMRLTRTLKDGGNIDIMIPSGYAAVVDDAKCAACGKCAGECFFEAVTTDGDGRPVQDAGACMGCGLCVERCGVGARSLVLDPSRGYPLDLDFVREEPVRQGG
jgi:ferredoxin